MEPGRQFQHRYAEYGDDTELAYHLHYDHGLPLQEAMASLHDGTVAGRHREAHS